jgi:hypothetical protein
VEHETSPSQLRSPISGYNLDCLVVLKLLLENDKIINGSIGEIRDTELLMQSGNYFETSKPLPYVSAVIGTLSPS